MIDIPEAEIPEKFRNENPNGHLYRIKARSPTKLDEKTRNCIHQKLEEAAGKIDFLLVSGWSVTSSGLPDYSGDFCYGMTQHPVWVKPCNKGRGRKILVHLAYEQFEALLRDDLTCAERRVEHFICACTILHELAVSLPLLLPIDSPILLPPFLLADLVYYSMRYGYTFIETMDLVSNLLVQGQSVVTCTFLNIWLLTIRGRSSFVFF